MPSLTGSTVYRKVTGRPLMSSSSSMIRLLDTPTMNVTKEMNVKGGNLRFGPAVDYILFNKCSFCDTTETAVFQKKNCACTNCISISTFS